MLFIYLLNSATIIFHFLQLCWDQYNNLRIKIILRLDVQTSVLTACRYYFIYSFIIHIYYTTLIAHLKFPLFAISTVNHISFIVLYVLLNICGLCLFIKCL